MQVFNKKKTPYLTYFISFYLKFIRNYPKKPTKTEKPVKFHWFFKKLGNNLYFLLKVIRTLNYPSFFNFFIHISLDCRFIKPPIGCN